MERVGAAAAARVRVMRFADRVAIVTGAGGAIGGAIAARLQSEGARLVLGDLAPLEWEGAVTVAGDLSEPGEAKRLVDACLAEHGRLDVLVNNAGGGVIRPTLEHTEETLEATIDRNLWTAVRSTLAALPHMLERGYGRVVF